MGKEFSHLYGKQAEQFAYVNISKALIHEEAFSDVSLEAKMLYGLIMERMGMYRKNKWQDDRPCQPVHKKWVLDEEGKTYIHYSVADIMADTGCGKNKILKCLKELEEDVHLIERKKQGQGRPDMIYVKNFAIEEVEEVVEKNSEVCNVNPTGAV